MRKRSGWSSTCKYCGAVVSFKDIGAGVIVAVDAGKPPVAVLEGEGNTEIISIEGKKIRGERLKGLSHVDRYGKMQPGVHIGSTIHRCREFEERRKSFA